MRIYLDRFFAFYTHHQQNWVEVEVPQPERLKDVLVGLGIPIAEVQLAVVNGEAIDPEQAVISEKDEIKLYPPFGGG